MMHACFKSPQIPDERPSDHPWEAGIHGDAQNHVDSTKLDPERYGHDTVGELKHNRYIWFEPTQDRIKKTSIPVLYQHGNYLYDFTHIAIRLIGHSDELQDFGVNMQLGLDRTSRIIEILEDYDLPVTYFSQISHGQMGKPNKPIDCEDCESGNNYVEMIYLKCPRDEPQNPGKFDISKCELF